MRRPRIPPPPTVPALVATVPALVATVPALVATVPARVATVPARVAVLLALVTVLFASACAGDLENPDRFEAPTQDGCDLEVVEDIFEPKCGNPACHGAGEGPAADLDLVSPGVADRLVGVEGGAEGQCADRVRVDPNDIDGSLLLEKLEPDPSCGDRMPLLIEPLSAEEVACVRDWVRELVPAEEADAGVPPEGGDS